MTEPKWQTLEGVQVPFQVHVYRTGFGALEISNSPRGPVGSPVTIVRVASGPHGWRLGVTDTGEPVVLWGPATKMWVTE